ncbi:MAG: type I-C CRISPR-associated protein Cas8c/Csd1 [Deltaproteobacteria bacterium]|nr:type I-C CRISPR-associated protein Cas8c/Csd1 [Deltaproteobacteria bacterium]
MILRALADYYERMRSDPNCDVAPPGFEKKAIPFLLVINQQGQLTNIRDTRTGEGKKKTAREFMVPQGEKKTSGIKPNLLWDNSQYVLGSPKSDSEKDKKKAEDAFSAFRKRFDETFDESFQDEGINALRGFLSKGNFSPVFDYELWPEIKNSNANLSFLLEGESRLIAQRKSVIEHITERMKPIGKLQACAVTGKKDVPVLLHTAIKGVWGAQSSGANIVSFNLEAFRSFGKKQGLNAPVGQHTEFAYTTALNMLLAKGSRQRIQVGDASTVFWARAEHPFEDDFSCFLGEPPKGKNPDYGRIRSLLKAVKTGVLPKEDDMPFYVLGLAPNASRIAIRFWYEGNVRDLKQKIAQHFEDIEIVCAPHDRKFLSLFRLLLSIVPEKSDRKADNIPPNLGGQLARAVLAGTPYPRTLLSGAVRRCKAEQKITHARAAIIKGFLVREARFRKSTKKEVQMALDKTNTNIGYVLGRLFSVFERIQEQAQTGLNKTIKDTYFSAASSSPQVTFKRLHELAIHHLAKIRNSGQSTIWLEKLIQEVMDKVPAEGPPTTLALEDQGRFAIGYYHQRQDFFTKKEKDTKGDNI